MTHDFQVEAAKAGIAEAGGTPREFTTVSVSDGISMNHEGMKFSLFSRELIADSIEAVIHGLAYDALIGLRCDKTLPRDDGHDPLQCTVDLHLWRQRAAGRFQGKTLTVLIPTSVGGFMTGEIDQATLTGIERTCLPRLALCRAVHRQYHGDGFGSDGPDHSERLDGPWRSTPSVRGLRVRPAAGDADPGAGRRWREIVSANRWKMAPRLSPHR